MNRTLARFVVSLWCGWVIIQAPFVGKTGSKSDPTRPIKEWDVASFGDRNYIPAFDTAKECQEVIKNMTLSERPNRCVPIDWFRPHPWWQFWK